MKNKFNKSKVKRLFSAIEVADQVMGVFNGADYLLNVFPGELAGQPDRCVITFTLGYDDNYVVTEQALSNAVIKNNMITLVCEGGRVITIKLFRSVQVEIK